MMVLVLLLLLTLRSMSCNVDKKWHKFTWRISLITQSERVVSNLIEELELEIGKQPMEKIKPNNQRVNLLAKWTGVQTA